MKRLFRFGAVLCCLMLMASCSSTKIMLQQDYLSQKINEGSLAIVILDRQPDIQYSGNLKPEFGDGNPEELVLNYFKNQLPVDIKNRTTLKDIMVFKGEENSNVNYATREVDIWKDGFIFKLKNKIDVKVPVKGQRFQFSGFNPQFVLIIDNLHIGTKFISYSSTMGANGMMMNGGSAKTLNYISDFAIWNNAKADLVSFGHIEKSEQNILNVITMTTWKDLSDDYVTGIFADSPFRNFTYESLHSWQNHGMHR